MGKKSMLTKILLVLAVLVLVLVGVVALRPSEFRVTRTGMVPGSPSISFAQVNDFHKWDAWSPWARIDQGMKQTYEGSPSGKGAIYTWSGNSQVGQGRMEIVESRSNEVIRIDLQFLKPFPGNCPTEFTFIPQGGDTQVTWTMSGRHTFVPKAVSLFLSMDQMIGKQFEQGLAQLRDVCEGAARNGAAALPAKSP